MIQSIMNAAVLGSIYLLFSMGMSLAWGTVGILNFAHGAIFMFSSFAVYLITSMTALPAILCVIIAALVGAILSVLMQTLVYGVIRKRSTDHHAAERNVIIGGIGLAAILIGFASHATKSGSFGFATTDQNPVLEFAGIRITAVSLTIFVVAIAISIALAMWIRRSRGGLALRTVGVDAETAKLMGINESRLAIGTMAFAGLLAGLAGGLLTIHLVAINPTTGDGLLLKAFAAIILGGVGSVLGVVIGSFVLAFVETFMILGGVGGWASAVAFAIIFLVLIIRPRGLFGRAEVRRT